MKDGWSGIDIRFVVDESRTGSKEVCFWRVVFEPGARRFKHRHANSDEVICFISGAGDEEVEVKAGDVHFISRNTTHWLRNLEPDEDLEACGCYISTGTLEGSGYVFEGGITEADMTVRE